MDEGERDWKGGSYGLVTACPLLVRKAQTGLCEGSGTSVAKGRKPGKSWGCPGMSGCGGRADDMGRTGHEWTVLPAPIPRRCVGPDGVVLPPPQSFPRTSADGTRPLAFPPPILATSGAMVATPRGTPMLSHRSDLDPSWEETRLLDGAQSPVAPVFPKSPHPVFYWVGGPP